MACFVVPAAEAVVVTAATLIVKAREKKKVTDDISYEAADDGRLENAKKLPFSRKLSWLCYLLWGGSILLAFEHLWHGEVEPWFPFLTAASSPESMATMLNEMSTVGVAMAILVTVVWVGMLIVSSAMEKKAYKSALKAESKM